MVFFNFSMVFFWFSSIVAMVSSIFHGVLPFFNGFLHFFYVFLQFVHGVHSVFTCFHFWFQSCSLILTWFSLFFIEVFIYFWKYTMCKLEIVDVERYICMTNHDYMYM